MIFFNTELLVTEKAFKWGNIYRISNLGVFPEEGSEDKTRAIPIMVSEKLVNDKVFLDDDGNTRLPYGQLPNYTIKLTKGGGMRIEELKDGESDDDLYLVLSSCVTGDRIVKYGNVAIPKGDEDKISIIASGFGVGGKTSKSPTGKYKWDAFILKVSDYKKKDLLLKIRYADSGQAQEYIFVHDGGKVLIIDELSILGVETVQEFLKLMNSEDVPPRICAIGIPLNDVSNYDELSMKYDKEQWTSINMKTIKREVLPQIETFRPNNDRKPYRRNTKGTTNRPNNKKR